MNILDCAILITAVLLICVGLFMLVKSNHLIRLIIAVEVGMKAITLLMVFAGWLNGQIALSQAFVITIIVIEVVIAVVAAGIAINVFRKKGSMKVDALHNMHG